MFAALMSISPAILALSLGAAAFIIVLTIWHRSDKTSLDLIDVLVDQTGKFSLNKLGQLVALLFSTWILVNETLEGRLTDWLFTGYMLAWAGANLTSKFLDQRDERLKDK